MASRGRAPQYVGRHAGLRLQGTSAWSAIRRRQEWTKQPCFGNHFAGDLRGQETMAGVLAKAVQIRRIWRGRDLKISASGVARARPTADLAQHEPGKLPERQLTAHELIRMAQAARRAQTGPVANFSRPMGELCENAARPSF
jgi:hypothetical protein